MIDLGDLSSSRYREVVVRLAPPAATSRDVSHATSSSGTTETIRTYSALVYADPSVTALGPANPEQDMRSSNLAGAPATLVGLPLASVEQVTIRWGRYQDYLASFITGQRNPSQFGNQLFEALSPGLERLFSGTLPGPLRVWWATEAPELEDLPWELVAYASPQTRNPSSPSSIFFVRGMPPETIAPLLPVADPLRLGFIYDPSTSFGKLRDALGHIGPSVQVIEMTGPPREALRTAVKEGFELLHVVADGLVSLAFEGVLYLQYDSVHELPVSELSSLLSGSRVTVLALSAPERNYDAETLLIRNRTVPSAFRAFAYLGRATLPLPSIVAPLGPMLLPSPFWPAFYASLGDSLALDKALLAAQQSSDTPAPVALFSRHAYGQVFRRSHPSTLEREEDLAQVSQRLDISQKAVAALSTVAERFPDTAPSLDTYTREETEHQERMKEQLRPWQTLDGDER